MDSNPSANIAFSPNVSATPFTNEAPGGTANFPAVWKTSASAAKSCTPAQTIVPLTKDKSLLKATIDQFSASGSTAGHLGTAWGWYMLSPKWASVFTGDAAPGAYDTPKLKKIAVLMTDGEFNLFYAKNAQGQAIPGDSASQAEARCASMKAEGIEIYTVGFKLDNQAAIDTLNARATDATHVFRAEDGAALDAAFKEVAFRAVPLRIAK